MKDLESLITQLKDKHNINDFVITQCHKDELYLEVKPGDFKNICVGLHQALKSPVKMFFALDQISLKNGFEVICVFMALKLKKFILVKTIIDKDNPAIDSLAKVVYSAALFEREIKEMFGLTLLNNPDSRSLRLHEEVWPVKSFPLKKDFKKEEAVICSTSEYEFLKVSGGGIFEVPVGPVHAGIIGPGHFRFSVAGEPIINLETRFGFAHKGIEKLFEGKLAREAVKLAECVCGDASVTNSLAFTMAVEKIFDITVSQKCAFIRILFLELERIYNHINDIGGMALDVGFSFPSASASLIKEDMLNLNQALSGSRYLKNINSIGGMHKDFGDKETQLIKKVISSVSKDFIRLAEILNTSVSFLDRVDSTGILKKKTAEDLGVSGLAGRASGIRADLRADFPGAYSFLRFNLISEESGDVLARLKLRISEVEESFRLINEILDKINPGDKVVVPAAQKLKAGFALGYAEGFRGPIYYWIKIDSQGVIERCKIVDSSFCNWQGLSFAVLGNIIPDFPLCNKSFNLSYSGNDL